MTAPHEEPRRASLAGAEVIDPRVLRDDPDRVAAAQAKRGLPDDVVDRALAADAARRQAIAEFEAKRAEQKQLGKQIPQAQGEEKQELLARTKELAAEVKAAEAAQAEAEAEWQAALMAIPNLAADEAPGRAARTTSSCSRRRTPRDFEVEGFEPRDHVELGRILGAIDLERGAKVSGSPVLLPHRGRRPARVRAGSTWRWTRPATPASPR